MSVVLRFDLEISVLKQSTEEYSLAFDADLV